MPKTIAISLRSGVLISPLLSAIFRSRTLYRQFDFGKDATRTDVPRVLPDAVSAEARDQLAQPAVRRLVRLLKSYLGAGWAGDTVRP
jgi:hypothetical protein